MLRNSTQQACLKGLAVMTLAGWQAQAQVLALMTDKAQVPATVLVEALQVTTRLYEKAGIQLRFVDCTSATALCDRLVAQRPLFLRLLPTRPVQPMSRAALGYSNTTPEGGDTAAIFYPQLDDLIGTHRPQASRAQLLGHAMAHEIGHLLAGPDHRPSGLMRADWSRADYQEMARGLMLIAAPDAARMRQDVKRRAGAAPHVAQ